MGTLVTVASGAKTSPLKMKMTMVMGSTKWEPLLGKALYLALLGAETPFTTKAKTVLFIDKKTKASKMSLESSTTETLTTSKSFYQF